jgi:hypothetical protein
MARLHRFAYRIVWANPRTQSDRYRPEVGGMAAAWPYCDAVVSAHNFESLDDLLAALRAPRVHRPSFVPPGGAGTDAAPGAAVAVGAGGASATQPPSLSLPITQHLGRRLGRLRGWAHATDSSLDRYVSFVTMPELKVLT